MFTLNCKGTLLSLESPKVMGIINVNTDSFYKQSRKLSTDEVVAQAERMLGEGADILDLGGQSTSPGSPAISAEQEASRVIPAIERLIERFPQSLISIDTYYSEVAKLAVQAGASMVNDISAGELDDQMHATVAQLKVPYIAMHMRGNAATMQQFCDYKDVTREVLDYFIQKAAQCKKAGIVDLVIDPGFGFAKNTTQNYELLRNLACFSILDLPILVGVSRKSMIYKSLNTSPEEALNGSTVLHTFAIQNGAHILRTHDVKEAKEVLFLLGKLQQR